MIASALSRFHGMKELSQGAHKSVATAVLVAAPIKKDPQEPIKADVLPKKDGPPPVAAPQVTAEVKPSDKKAADQKTTDQKSAGTTQTVPTTTAATPQVQKNANGTFSNEFDDADLKSLLTQLVQATGANISVDDTFKDKDREISVTIKFDNDTIDQVVEKVATAYGAYWEQVNPGQYIISKATLDSANYSKFVKTKFYTTKNQNAATIQALLSPNYKTYVSVDPKTNRIGVSAPKQLLEKIMADIMDADKPLRQVMIEALVTEMTVEDSLASGFSWNTNNLSLGTDLSITYQPSGFTDMIKMQAAITNQKARLRAQPHLLTMSGEEATVSVGQDTYYSLLSGSTIYPTSQIQLIHTGVVLKFTAIIGDDGYITMALSPSISDAVVAVNGNPTSNIRTVTNRLRVKSGQQIVIAGLIQETGSKQIIRVPILGYIPLIGEIFTQRSDTKKKVETIFIITPHIVDGP